MRAAHVPRLKPIRRSPAVHVPSRAESRGRRCLRWSVQCMAILAPIACGTKTVTGPVPPVSLEPQATFTAPATFPSPGGSCQPLVTAQLAGPDGSGLTWTGMGIHVHGSNFDDFDEDLDLAFVQRFWNSVGLTPGESLSANSMAFATITDTTVVTMRFYYVLSGQPDTLRDSVITACTP